MVGSRSPTIAPKRDGDPCSTLTRSCRQTGHLEADGALRLLWHPFLGLMPPKVYVPSPLQATAYKHIVLIVLLCSAFYSSLAVLHLPELNQGSSTTTRSAGKCTIGASTVLPGSASLQSLSRLLLISSTIQPTGSKPMRCRCRQSTACNDGIPLCCTMSLHTCAFLSQEHEQNPLS